MSKLAALAAKRRQKESEQKSAPAADVDAKPKDDYVASLEKLKVSQAPKIKPGPASDIQDSAPNSTSAPQAERPLPQEAKETLEESRNQNLAEDLISGVGIRARPSAFGIIMTNHDAAAGQALLALFPTAPAAMPANFAGPSPDDIVTRAQTGKGRP
jgi:elongation factor 1 alpha-like protein